MQREALWKAHAQERDALQVALVAWTATATLQTLAALDDAASQYLRGVIRVPRRRRETDHDASQL